MCTPTASDVGGIENTPGADDHKRLWRACTDRTQVVVSPPFTVVATEMVEALIFQIIKLQ